MQEVADLGGVHQAIGDIAQFIGHKIEGKKPSFFTDVVYLLIGPIWVLAKFYRRMGWKY